VAAFLALRFLGKLGGARMAARFNDMLPILGANWGRALLGQGGLALAIAFSYLVQPNAVLPNIVFTAAVASVLLTDLVSARLVNAAVGASPEAARTSGAIPILPEANEPDAATPEAAAPRVH
jgi:hypothetical protein